MPLRFGLGNADSRDDGHWFSCKKGILIKSGKALEIARDLDIVIFDKTGTLTKGEPSVTDIIKVKNEISENLILQIAASVEKNSEHPLAQADLGIALGSGTDVAMETGEIVLIKKERRFFGGITVKTVNT